MLDSIFEILVFGCFVWAIDNGQHVVDLFYVLIVKPSFSRISCTFFRCDPFKVMVFPSMNPPVPQRLLSFDSRFLITCGLCWMSEITVMGFPVRGLRFIWMVTFIRRGDLLGLVAI